MSHLLDYFAAVLTRGELLPPDSEFADNLDQPKAPAEVYVAVLSGKPFSLHC